MRLYILPLALFLMTCANRTHYVMPDVPDVRPDGIRWIKGRAVVADWAPITWKFHCTFPDDQKTDAEEGFSYWDDLTERPLFQEVGCTEHADILVRHKKTKSSDNEHWWASCHSRWGPLGGWDHATITYYQTYLNTDPAWVNLRWSISRHEVGHALGLVHLEKDMSCIMYPYINSPDPLTTGPVKDTCAYEKELFMRYYGGKETVPVR